MHAPSSPPDIARPAGQRLTGQHAWTLLQPGLFGSTVVNLAQNNMGMTIKVCFALLVQ